jgi:signal transduction histidine kinase
LLGSEVEAHLDELALLMGLATSALLALLVLVIVRSRGFALEEVERATTTLRADIHRREVVEADLRSTQVALEIADRARSEFVSTVSHELRTPLTSIQGYSEMLTDGEAGALTPPQQRMVDVVERNARRLLALVEDLLSLSSIRAGTLRLERKRVDVAEVVDGALDALAPTMASRELTFEVAVEPEVGSVIGDRGQLERVLLNLLSNALKYTPDGGRIGLEVMTAGSRARLVVSDSGIGIPFEEQHELFEPFFRSSTATDAAIQGTGLGLVIVRSVVEAHGGEVELRSAPGAGTTVTVWLPLALRERAGAALALAAAGNDEAQEGN